MEVCAASVEAVHQDQIAAADTGIAAMTTTVREQDPLSTVMMTFITAPREIVVVTTGHAAETADTVETGEDETTVIGGGRGERGGRDNRRSPQGGKPAEPTDDERDRRTVFVQQLAARLRSRELKEFFEQAGSVVDAQIVKDRVSGRSKG